MGLLQLKCTSAHTVSSCRGLPEGMGRNYYHGDQDEVLELFNNFRVFDEIVEPLQHPLSEVLAKCLQNPRIQDHTQNDQVQASCTVGRSGTAPKE